MAGILESLFDGGGWQQLLGISQAEAAPTTPPPPPPPSLMQSGPAFSPTSTLGAGGPLSFNDRAQPVETAIKEGVFEPRDNPRGMNYTDFKPMPVGMTQRNVPVRMPADSPPQPYTTQADSSTPSPASPGAMPVSGGPAMPSPSMARPVPRPPVTMPLPSSAMPNGAEEIVPGGTPLPLSQNGGAPMPPPGALSGGPPTMSGGGGLMAALGLGSPQGRQSALAGVGRGLSAVGQMRSGAPRGAALATGLGGGIQGQQAKEREQTEDVLKAKKEAFTEDLQTKNYNINNLNAAIRLRQQEMQIPWWQARTEVLQAQKGQSAASKAWQMSDPGKYHMVDREVESHRKGLEALYREELKQASVNGEDEKLAKIRKLIKDDTDKVREEKYKIYGLDPAKRDATIKRGFEGAEDQIKYLAPGTRFWDAKAGVTRVRGSDRDNAPIGADVAAAAAMPSVPGLPAATEAE